MLYYFFQSLTDSVSGFNVFHYITFRSMVALLMALFLGIFCGPKFISWLKSMQIGQQIRDDGPKSHFSKKGTPTMGGFLILFSIVVPALCWMKLENMFLWCGLAILFGFFAVGFVDDYRKVKKKNHKGLSGKTRLLIESIISACVVYIFYVDLNPEGVLYFPVFKEFSLDLGWWFVPFGTLVIVGAANAVNLTDGLDGLATGPVVIATMCLGVFAYCVGHKNFADYLGFAHVPGAGELTVLAACVVGAGMGFLWFNTFPAQVFMGDVGSLPLGAILGAMAVFTHNEILLVFLGGIFVMEAVSVITQVASFKLTGKRIFRMAPIHHHFELKGWPEPKVIVRFWIIAAILGLMSLMTLKLR